MFQFLRQRWFLLALLSSIGLGHALGAAAPESAPDVLNRLFGGVVRGLMNAAILFAMSVTIDTHELRRSVRKPGPVLWAVIVNALLMPLTAPLIMPLQLHPDFSIGYLIAASVPSTMAAASVWTRRAGGNDAISLLVTMVTNGACFFYTPLWLNTFAGQAIELNEQDLMLKLLLTALLPTALGQLVRCRPAIAQFADRWKLSFGVGAQLGILVIVFVAAADGGSRIVNGHEAASAAHPTPDLPALLVVIASCVGLHLTALLVALWGSRLAGVVPTDAIAVAFAGSQKTLPIGVLIATDPRTFGAAFPWAVFPMLIFHASQLFIDTAIADRLQRWSHSKRADTPTEEVASSGG